MEQSRITTLIEEAKAGNEFSREFVIRHYKPYILNTTANLSNRMITWSDEEASVGLLAFNKAIDSFDSNKGRPFLDYVYLLIKRDLIDFFRKENRHLDLSFESLETETRSDENPATSESGMEAYKDAVFTAELAEEILDFDQILATYQVSFEELEDYSPKHRDTRNELLRMADAFLQEAECVEQLLRKKRLPIKLFCKNTEYKPKTVERHRKYLIAIIVIKLNPEWVHLSQYLHQASGNEGSL